VRARSLKAFQKANPEHPCARCGKSTRKTNLCQRCSTSLFHANRYDTAMKNKYLKKGE
jgi:hypothetical protein